VSAIIIDTSSWISYFSGKNSFEHEVDLALKEGRVYLSPIVTAELLSAFLKPKERQSLIDFLSDLPLISLSLDHWIRAGDLRSHLLRKGMNISTPDAHIAQCCLDLDGYLLTEDKIFQRMIPHINLKIIL
jgi:hypothetical protein